MSFKYKVFYFILLILLAGYVAKEWNDTTSHNARMETAIIFNSCDKKDQKGNEEFCNKFKNFQPKEK